MKAVSDTTSRQVAHRAAALPLALSFPLAVAMTDADEFAAIVSRIESFVRDLADRYAAEGLGPDRRAAARTLRHVRRVARRPADPEEADLIAVLEFIVNHGLAGDVAGIVCARAAQTRPSR